MNPFRQSLIGRIRFLGLLLAVLIIFILLLAYEATVFYAKREQGHHAIKIHALLKQHDTSLNAYLKEKAIQRISPEDALKAIAQADLFITDELIRSVAKSLGMELYLYKNHTYFVLKSSGTAFYFKTDKTLISSIVFPLSIYIFLLFLLLYAIFYYVKNSLSPLVRLHKHIDDFSQGKEPETNYETSNDEIAQVANAFYSALEHNKKLKAQRDMYIRTIMHEIKTPLTKARFLMHFMKDEVEEKSKLGMLFDSMEDELEKLHEFEKINMKLLSLRLSSHCVNSLLDDVVDVLLIEDSQLDLEAEKVYVNFDYDLFIIAVKNLLDNALKYSGDKKVSIRLNSARLEIKNRALENKKLDISTLAEPFKQEDESSIGMGLGLYLAKEIITQHRFTLEYTYTDRCHIFTIVFPKKESA